MLNFEDLTDKEKLKLKNKKAEIEAYARVFLGIVFILVMLVYLMMGFIDGFLNKLYTVLILLTILAIGIKIDDKRKEKKRETLISKVINKIFPILFSIIFLLGFSFLITASQMVTSKVLQGSANNGISSIEAFKIALLIIGVTYIISGILRLTYKNDSLDSKLGRRKTIVNSMISGTIAILLILFIFKLNLIFFFFYGFILIIILSQNNKTWETSVMMINLSQFNDSKENTKNIKFKDTITITSTQYFMLFRYNGNTYLDLTATSSISGGLLSSLYIFQTVLEILYSKEINDSDYKKLSIKDTIMAKSKFEYKNRKK